MQGLGTVVVEVGSVGVEGYGEVMDIRRTDTERFGELPGQQSSIANVTGSATVVVHGQHQVLDFQVCLLDMVNDIQERFLQGLLKFFQKLSAPDPKWPGSSRQSKVETPGTTGNLLRRPVHRKVCRRQCEPAVGAADQDGVAEGR